MPAMPDPMGAASRRAPVHGRSAARMDTPA